MTATLALHPANDAGNLPANIEAEQALLGAVMYGNEAFHLCEITEADFHEPFHGRLWAAMAAKINKGLLAEPVTLIDGFAGDPAYEELGGLSYLIDLIDRAPPAANAPQYARTIRHAALRRNLVDLGNIVSRAAMEDGTDAAPDEIIALAANRLSELEVGHTGDHWEAAGSAVRTALQSARTRTGRIDYPTGIASLDRMLGGLHAGEVSILAARPGMGKSVGAATIARAQAEHGLGVCLFSKEMTKEAMALRLACDLVFSRSAPVYSGVPTCPTFDKAMKGELDARQWAELDRAADEIDRWALAIDDRAGLTMREIEAAARRRHREWARQGISPGAVIIDHLGKVRPPTDRRGSKHAEVADVSNEAQGMAKRLGVPVLALVQLNRGVEGREDKRPMLSDLRQAGELEEDARQVIFLFRPEYYCRDGSPTETYDQRIERLDKLDQCKNQLFWIIEKNSHGPRGQVQSFCEIACSAIREW